MSQYEWLLAVALFGLGYLVGKVRESEREQPVAFVIQDVRRLLRRRR